MARKERLSYRDKYKDKQQWFKDNIDRISEQSLRREDKLRMKVNYDLYNNIINQEEFSHVCKPIGEKVGALPLEMQNRDIVSGKIKTLLGMEMQRPFTYKVFSTNPEATTEREKKEFEMIRQHVIDMIMLPIQQQVEQQKQQELMALQAQAQQDPSPEGQQQIQEQAQQIEAQAQEQVKQMTPFEIKKYMQREYQDPAEVLCSQLLEYLKHKCDIKNKFSTMFKNALLTARSIMYVGIMDGEPDVWVVNPMRFNFARSADCENIEDAEWAVCEYKMSPSQVTRYFSKDLSDNDLEDIFAYSRKFNLDHEAQASDLFFEMDNELEDDDITIYHCVWKSLRKIGFLTFIDENGQEQEILVDEHYKLEEDIGDIRIEWEWIPEVYEGWKIKSLTDIYVQMRPVPGQFKDIDNIRHCKLPYYGTVYDNYNSLETSLMDRLKYYQYLYNIVMYRLELLMASDKGKKLLMNINNVPDSLGIDMHKWQYFVESSPYIWFNPSEEGNQTQDANTVAKVMDMSLVSDIQKYMQLAEYIRQQCGKSVGITEQVEGQIGQYEAVRNTNQALIQSSYILEYYFVTHDRCRTNILMALLETAKVCYSQEQPRKINYILDDLSKQTINVDPAVLDNSTLGIFVSSSTKAEQTKEIIQQLAHAALQNQTVEFSDIIAIMNSESVPEATEMLKAAEQRRNELQEAMQKQQQEHEMQMQQQQQEAANQQFEMQKELMVLREEERRKTELVKMSLMGASYNPDHDGDEDGVNDFIELSKLELEKFSREEDLRLQRDKLSVERMKAQSEASIRTIDAQNKAAQYRQQKSNRPR